MKKSLCLLRVAMGWMYLYAGLSKIVDPQWSAAGYLSSAKTFPGLYQWFAGPANIGWVNLVNEWGLALIGLALILGFYTRYAALAGIMIMLLYYFPVLQFPYAGEHSFIVDEHIIYAGALFVLMSSGAGKYWGLDSRR